MLINIICYVYIYANELYNFIYSEVCVAQKKCRSLIDSTPSLNKNRHTHTLSDRNMIIIVVAPIGLIERRTTHARVSLYACICIYCAARDTSRTPPPERLKAIGTTRTRLYTFNRSLIMIRCDSAYIIYSAE